MPYPIQLMEHKILKKRKADKVVPKRYCQAQFHLAITVAIELSEPYEYQATRHIASATRPF